MKTSAILTVALLGLSAPLLRAGDSERTAEHILTTPADYEGKQVTLDVAFVKPVHWKSPVAELAFFHALTMDRNDLKAGGAILVAVPAAESAAFAKKYGTDYEGRYEKDVLTGTLLASPGRGPGKKVWFVDTTGGVLELIKQNKLNLEDDGGGEGPGEGRRAQGWRERRKDRAAEKAAAEAPVQE